MALTKRQKVINQRIYGAELKPSDFQKSYSFEDALNLLKEVHKTKFDETVNIVFELGIDPKKAEQGVRGSCVLPRGTGKKVRVAVFAQGAQAEAAKSAGADIVGFEDLADTIKAGHLDFDVLIATPDAMKLVGQLGPILGPRSLMPNPKDGTVTQDVKLAVNNAKSGQVKFRNEKAGIVHSIIGKLSLSTDDLKENAIALVNEIKKLKPSTSKGIYIKKMVLSSTMGPGLVLEQSSF